MECDNDCQLKSANYPLERFCFRARGSLVAKDQSAIGNWQLAMPLASNHHYVAGDSAA